MRTEKITDTYKVVQALVYCERIPLSKYISPTYTPIVKGTPPQDLEKKMPFSSLSDSPQAAKLKHTVYILIAVY